MFWYGDIHPNRASDSTIGILLFGIVVFPTASARVQCLHVLHVVCVFFFFFPVAAKLASCALV